MKISILNVNASYKSVTSIHFSEYLLCLLFHKNNQLGVSVMAQWKQIRLGTMRLQVQSLALLNRLMIQLCHELWYKSQMWLGSDVAVALA